MPPRILSEDEYNSLRDSVLKSAPNGLKEEDFQRYIGPAMEQALGQAENSPEPLKGSALERFASGAWKNVNPVTMVEGLANAAIHPIDTAKSIIAAHEEQLAKAKDAYSKGQYSEAIGHLGAAALPIVGPAAANASERIGSGDVAGGLGEAAGLIAPLGAAEAANKLGKAWGIVPKSSREVIADRLSQVSQQKVADVIAPKVGANKARLGNQAANVAPQLLEAGDVRGFSREALQTHIEGKLAEAQDALDTAADNRLSARSLPTAPIVADLQAKRAALIAHPIEGSLTKPELTDLTSKGEETNLTKRIAKPIGKTVEPNPNADRLRAIDQAISEVKTLGPVASYESLRRIRQAWDQPARIKYNPSVTQDFLKNQGYSSGAADVTGSLRDALAKFDPETAKANAQYSLYKKANDVLAATEEVERTRPKIGRQIMTRLTTSMIGEQAAGIPGAVAGFVLGPVLDQAVSSGLTTKLQTARLLDSLAGAIRKGDLGHVASLKARLARAAAVSSAVQTGNLSVPTGVGALAPTP